MAIFIQASFEAVVQLGDKTRIDVSKTFISPDEAAITEITITPESGGDAIDVTTDKYLDWAYTTAGEKAATVSVTTDGAATTKELTINAISLADDKLFSNDNDILSHEVDLYRLLRPGRASFLDFHRIAQKMIIDDLNQRGITDNQGNKIVKADIFDIEEVKEWSKYLTLSLIFKSVQSEIDDIYDQKSQMYMDMAKRESTRAFLRLDLDGDGTDDRHQDLISTVMVRR